MDLNVWPPVAKSRGRGRNPIKIQNEPGCDPVDLNSENTAITVSATDEQQQAEAVTGTVPAEPEPKVVTAPESEPEGVIVSDLEPVRAAVTDAEPEHVSVTAQEPEPVAIPQQRYFTIDMSVEPPPIPLLFDAEAASKKRKDDGDFDEIQITIDDPELACPADADTSSSIGQSSAAFAKPAEVGLPPSGIEMFDDSDQKEHKKGPSSLASSTSSQKNKDKENELARILFEESGRWFADPRIRKRMAMAQQLASRIDPADVATAIENAKVGQQNVDTPLVGPDPEMADIDISQEISNTLASASLITNGLAHDATETSHSQNTNLMNGGTERTATPVAKVNGFTLDTHRFGLEVGDNDEDMSDGAPTPSSRDQRNRELMMRRRRGNNLPDSERNVAAATAIPEVMEVEDNASTSRENEASEYLLALENTKFIPALRILPYARQRNPGGKKSGIQILKELAEEFNIKPVYNFEAVENVEDADGPIEFKVSVFAGLRDGTGTGATRKEAMLDAAENCLRNIKISNPEFDVNLDFKKFIRTEPDKDILYVLRRMCKDFDLADPEYDCIIDENELVTFTCHVGDFAMEGRGRKKRTSQRKAALNMYQFIRELYNFDRTNEIFQF